MLRALTRAAVVAVGFSSIFLGSRQALADEAPTADPTKVPAAKPSSSAAGISLGLRVGWAFPIGSLASGEPLSSNYNGMLPVWLDLGYRLNPSWYVGGYFQWGAAFVNGDLCPAIISCSATDLRFGANVHWHFLAADASDGLVDPWVGLGAGYEIATTHIEGNNSKSHETNRGFEFVNAQIGADYVGFAPLRLGAFGALTVAEFQRHSVSVPTGPDGGAVAHPAVHLWAMLGLRGQYDF